MNFHDEYWAASSPFGDGLADPNEQEQRKSPPQKSKPPEEKPRRIDDPKPMGEPTEVLPHAFPIECPPRTLPEEGERHTAIEATISVGEPNSVPQGGGKRRRGSARFGSYLVMSGSLVVAFLLMIGVLCMKPSPDVFEDGGAESGEDAPAQKVIYVNQYGDGSGALSTPELYDRCIDSVVSISVSNGKTSGVGSGFVLREDGYIATAYHVVADMNNVAVIFTDGSRYEAEVIGGDALTDLALLRIGATGLSPVTLGSSASLLPGERVVAIGTPASLDYAGSVSSGEVSYALRTVKIFPDGTGTLEKKMKLIQTNAPVNPGNSGCPLFDSRGQVVGMVTMKLGNQFAGMGFAIPMDGAVEILEAMRTGEALTDSLLSSVSVRAARLGIVGEAFEVGGVYGVRVSACSEGGGAEGTLTVGDLITRLGDHVIARPADLEQALRAYDPGQTVSVTVLRNGQTLTFSVVLTAKGEEIKK